MQIGDVQPAVHRRYGRHLGHPRERKRPVVYMRVDDVETIARVIDLGQHRELQRRAELRLAMQTKRPRAPGRESRAGLRIARRKQRHVMTTLDQLFGDIRNNALATAIKFRRHLLIQWRYLRDTQAATAVSRSTSVF